MAVPGAPPASLRDLIADLRNEEPGALVRAEDFTAFAEIVDARLRALEPCPRFGGIAHEWDGTEQPAFCVHCKVPRPGLLR